MGLCDYCHKSQFDYYCYEETRNGNIEIHLCKGCFKKSKEYGKQWDEVIK